MICPKCQHEWDAEANAATRAELEALGRRVTEQRAKLRALEQQFAQKDQEWAALAAAIGKVA